MTDKLMEAIADAKIDSDKDGFYIYCGPVECANEILTAARRWAALEKGLQDKEHISRAVFLLNKTKEFRELTLAEQVLEHTMTAILSAMKVE